MSLLMGLEETGERMKRHGVFCLFPEAFFLSSSNNKHFVKKFFSEMQKREREIKKRQGVEIRVGRKTKLT